MILETHIQHSEYLKNTFRNNFLKVDVAINLIVINSVPVLSLRFDSEALPVSWFITDAFGNIVLAGMCNKNNLNIGLAALGNGNYTLRTKGEKLSFEI